MMLAGMATGFPAASPSGGVWPGGPEDEAVRLLLRVSLPDRPGALGLVASRIGAVRGDIVGIDVLERNSGGAIDEFGVVLPSAELMPLLIKEIEQAGARVEDVIVVSHMPDPRRDALEAAVRLCEAGDSDALCRLLTAYVGRSLLADWVVLVGRSGALLAVWGKEPPDAEKMARLRDEGWAHNGGVMAEVLTTAGVTLVAGRGEVAFRTRERTQLRALVVVADRVWELLPSPR